MIVLIALALVSGVLAGLRMAGVTHEAFQAVAHLWVGGLIGGWAALWWAIGPTSPGATDGGFGRCDRVRLWCGWLAVELIVVEAACFLYSMTAR